MEIKKIDDITSYISKKRKNIGYGVSDFNSQLEAVRNSFLQSDSNDTLSEEAKSALTTIEKVLDMKITSKDYKNNKKLDIVNIMRKHGNKLSSSEMKDFTKSLDILLDNDLIDHKDYVEVIQMISIQNKYRNISDNLEYEAINTITNNNDDSKNE